MKGKASDICTKCKHCEGLDMFAMYYNCKHYNNYPDAAIGVDGEIDCCNFEEVTMNKIEGKASDWCPKCKNCNAITHNYDGITAKITEVECEDPYDGMVKTLQADSDICCSMFEMKSEKSCDKISLLRHELEMDKLRMKIHELEKEKAAHMKGIERLKKSQEKLQNQVKNLQTTNEESYKREEKLEDKVRKLERRLLEENKSIYEDLKKRAAESDYYKEMSELLEERNNNQFDIIREKDKKIDTLLNTNKGLTDKIGSLKNKIVTQQSTHYKQCSRILELENMVSKLQSGEYDDILAKDIEIKSLRAKYEDAMAGWKDAIDTNDKQIEELTRRYNMIAQKLNDIHDILKEDETNE